jgi:hypothetical protein
VRPTKVFRGTQSPLRNCKNGELDWVIIRENSEGEYAGHGGRSHRGEPWETATEVSIFTRHAVERIMRFAFETAKNRPKKHITVVTKSNAQRNGMVMWDEVASDVAKDFPDVLVDKMLVDAMTTRMVLKPETLDTIVATNLVGHRFMRIHTGAGSNDTISTRIFFRILLRRWLVPSASHPPAISIPHERTLPCSSLSMALRSISLEWESVFLLLRKMLYGY